MAMYSGEKDMCSSGQFQTECSTLSTNSSNGTGQYRAYVCAVPTCTLPISTIRRKGETHLRPPPRACAIQFDRRLESGRQACRVCTLNFVRIHNLNFKGDRRRGFGRGAAPHTILDRRRPRAARLGARHFPRPTRRNASPSDILTTTTTTTTPRNGNHTHPPPQITMFNNKKFVPPLLRKPTAAPDDEPPAKKSRVEYPTASQPAGTRMLKITSTRKPLLLVRNATLAEPSAGAASSASPSAPAASTATEGYYNVLWRKKTTKKHKTFDGDGILIVSAGYAILQDTSGKDLGRTMMKALPALGDLVSISGKDVEIDSPLSKADYLAGRPFLRAAAAVEPLTAGFQAVSATGFFGAKAFKTPLLGSTVLVNTHGKEPTPRHDPTAEGALVMLRPDPKAVPAGKKVVDVVVDPYLTQHLRPHQRDGVKFLYEAVMGMKQFDGQGAILADEMGLGKTLQTIALLWTLLKQNPVHGEQPVVKKALIVCPVTLINNWRKEFRKWLGKERIGVFVADSKANLRDFTHGKVYSMMIIGYEKLQKVQAELRKTHIDIVIADEGHRLKTEKNKSAQAIRGLNTKRRVILSGTPLQNDLHEFYIMVDFVNPGLLESYATFRKEFETPIVKSRQPGVSSKDVEKGKARGAELARLTKMFVLRRTAEILAEYLPPKTEYVVFCRPSPKQVKVYKAILENPAFEGAYRSPDTSLLLITMLKKLCNSPGLLADKPGKETVIIFYSFIFYYCLAGTFFFLTLWKYRTKPSKPFCPPSTRSSSNLDPAPTVASSASLTACSSLSSRPPTKRSFSSLTTLARSTSYRHFSPAVASASYGSTGRRRRTGARSWSISLTEQIARRRSHSSYLPRAAARVSTSSVRPVWCCLTWTGTRPRTRRPWPASTEMARRSRSKSTAC